MKGRVLLIFVIVSAGGDCVRIDCVVLFGDMEYPVLGRLAIHSFPNCYHTRSDCKHHSSIISVHSLFSVPYMTLESHE